MLTFMRACVRSTLIEDAFLRSRGAFFLARAGRKRKPGARRVKGRPEGRALQPRHIPPTAELIDKREQLVGKELAGRSLAGYPLGILRLREIIDDRQFDAALALRALAFKFLRFADAPSPFTRAVDLGLPSRGSRGGGDDVVERAWGPVFRAYDAALTAATGHDTSLRSDLVGIVVSEMLPHWILGEESYWKRHQRARFGACCQRLAEHFKMAR